MSDHTMVVIWVIKIFVCSSSVYSCHLFLISSASVRSIQFLFFIVSIFAWNIHSILKSRDFTLSTNIRLVKAMVFPVSQFFSSRGQRIGVSASTSVLPMNIQDWFPLGLNGSPCSPRDSQESFPTPQFKRINSSAFSFLYSPTLTWDQISPS